MTANPGASFYGLVPEAGRGRALDAALHADLASSLRHVAEQTEQALPETSSRLAAVCDTLDAGRRVPALAVRMYYLIVQSVLVGDVDGIERSLARLEALGERAPSRRIIHFGEPMADQIGLELIEDGMRLAPITGAEAEAFSRLLDEALDLMRKALPDLYEEIDGIVHEVLLGRAPLGDKMEFDGASHYQFWGLLVLNPSHHKTALAVLEVLAHEASHSLLFGLTAQEPLVHNADDELYPSPLRLDPRPMDGIYHAAFVSARMWWAMDQLTRSDLLSEDERRFAREAADTDLENFEKGLSVIDAHARLSSTGARILDAVRRETAAARNAGTPQLVANGAGPAV